MMSNGASAKTSECPVNDRQNLIPLGGFFLVMSFSHGVGFLFARRASLLRAI